MVLNTLFFGRKETLPDPIPLAMPFLLLIGSSFPMLDLLLVLLTVIEPWRPLLAALGEGFTAERLSVLNY